MAENSLDLIIDTSGRRLVASFTSNQGAQLPPFTLGDERPITVRTVESTGILGQPWRDIALTNKTVRVALGTPGGRPTTGTFTISFGGDTTSALSLAATASDLQTALNALASVTTDGGVTVTGTPATGFKVVFNDVGVISDTFTITTENLSPASGAYITKIQTGTVSLRESVFLRFETVPVAYAELTTALPGPSATITDTRVGSTGVAAIKSLSLDPIPVGGAYTLTVEGETTAALTYNSSASEIQAAIVALASFEAGDVTVSGEFPVFSLLFDASFEAVTMTADTAALTVPVGKKGTFETTDGKIAELLAGRTRADVTFEIELYDTVSFESSTILQVATSVLDDVIPNSPSFESTTPTYLTLSDLTAFFPTYDDLAAANAGLDIGQVYYDTALGTLNTATD